MIKVTDLAHVRLRAPDLDAMETFLTDFGMVRAARTDRALYMRGTDAQHHLHITELGEPAFVGVGLQASSAADLDAIARADGASAVEDIDEPGGGRRVRLTDPNGIAVEVVHGIESVPALPPPPTRRINVGSDRRRLGEPQRVERGAAHVKRLGHFVLLVNDFRATEAFYHSHFGFVNSDEIYLGEPETVLAAFMRCDRGADYVDHLDDLMAGHEHLAARGYEHRWGVGRHIVGSQIYDYWRDPWGRVHELWTDGDLFNSANPTGAVPAEVEGPASHWGPPPPGPFGA
jgi:catechol 2,3-dioxygenase-like lactoylglutathione lyase family enzyme